MELREGYKQTEVGLIPEDWEVDHIKNHCDIKTGGKNTQDRVKDGIYPFFVRSQTVERINSYTFNGEAVLTAGDGVGTGKVFHYINGKFDCHQRVYRMSDFSDRLDGYYFYLYFSNNFYGRISQMTAKSSVDSVRMEMIADMNIPLPPTKAEQTAIATALSDVDALITQLEKLITKKRQIKQGAMQALLTGKRRLDGFGQDCNYRQTDFGLVPEDWEIKRIEEFAPLQRGFDLPNRERIHGNYPVVYSNGVVNYHHKYQVKGPGVVTGRSGTIGNVHYIESDFWPHNTSLWVKAFINSAPKFVYYLYKHIGLSRFASGSGVPTLNRNDAHSFNIALPSDIKEQQAIADSLTTLDNELEAIGEKLKKIQILKQGMMQSLLTGQIRLVEPAPKNEQ